ncbi:MAG: glycosyl transferase family 2 [Planctomycetes bacterium]|nr:glycosyl transferase family 2 [Planctomycetota bacterium]
MSDTWSVPSHQTFEFAPRKHRHCIAIFVIDEGERLHRQLEVMMPFEDLVDIIVADGGSTDGSIEEEELRSRGVNTLLVKTGLGRLGSQMRMAFAFALKRGYEGIVTIDGNGKDDPAAIPSFVAALSEGFDHLQGSRFIPGGKEVNTPRMRRFAVRMIHAPLISRAAGVRYTDTTNGFRAYSRRFLLDSKVCPFRDVFSGYELHYYLAIRAGELGFRIKEIAVTRSYPSQGPTPTKISPVRGNLAVLGKLVAACCHRYDPPKESP